VFRINQKGEISIFFEDWAGRRGSRRPQGTSRPHRTLTPRVLRIAPDGPKRAVLCARPVGIALLRGIAAILATASALSALDWDVRAPACR